MDYQFVREWDGLAHDILENNKSHGFWPEDPQDRNVGEALALVHSEISEGLEAHRKDLMDDKLPHRKGLEVELADAVIRIMDIGAGLGMDIAGAILEKHAFNKTREFRHGKKY